ncbi:hypothetical protein [Hymenobacter negativus]|uniref:Uncharacterized protein n=1 Tax=Hymenobacter negativus TaxID=2795026 RepID=A0ABS3QQE6_9BACT|nr:hypothetical protein [Hymenobacter negativus]MBO2012984.1 hypothetical protein [Hymenobacter negativus]
MADRLYGRKGRASVSCGGTSVRFELVPVTCNRLVPLWTFGMDTFPFDRKRFPNVRGHKKHRLPFLENSIGINYWHFE